MLAGVDIEIVLLRLLSWPWIAAPVPGCPHGLCEVSQQLRPGECRFQDFHKLLVLNACELKCWNRFLARREIGCIKVDLAMSFCFLYIFHAHKSNLLSIKQKITDLWDASEQDKECLLCNLHKYSAGSKSYTIYSQTHMHYHIHYSHKPS